MSFMAPIPAMDGDGAERGRGLVLVAEDDAPMRTLLVRFLTSLGYAVIEAADGRAAVPIALKRTPDMVLLDVHMPGKTGIEVLKELSPVLPATGFIMVTGSGNREAALFCMQLGAYDYLAKPVALDYLAHRIKTWFLRHKPAPS